jgi:hypothetical protein
LGYAALSKASSVSVACAKGSTHTSGWPSHHRRVTEIQRGARAASQSGARPHETRASASLHVAAHVLILQCACKVGIDTRYTLNGHTLIAKLLRLIHEVSTKRLLSWINVCVRLTVGAAA